jgi:multiple sugar transport system permease protein
MMGFYSGVPEELEEAGRVDGASRMGALFRIVLPLMIPAIVTTFLLAWTASWGELITATLFTRTLSAETLPVALNAATTNVAGGLGAVDYQALFAGATILTLPPVLIFVIFQRYFRPSMTLGALKG